jgi:ATP-dependent helicase/nuclease subunit A
MAPPGQSPPQASGRDASPPAPLPPWLFQDAPVETPHVFVTPSGAGEDAPIHAPQVRSGEERKKALLRGTIVHRLLQSLPDIAPERRAEAGRLVLARRSNDFSADERDEMLRGVLTLIAQPRFAEIFAPGSRAEVPIVALIPREHGPPLPVSGVIDRLAVAPATVFIADYKTNRPAPRRLEEVPEAYVSQLALYRAALALIYPEKEVRAALIWTETLELMQLPEQLLASRIAAMTGANLDAPGSRS